MAVTHKELKEYGTSQQFEEISESAMNGNWTQAIKECEEYGFFANDLIKHYEANEFNIIDLKDIAILAEGAEKLRHKDNA
jgi:hypothetical protein